MDGVLWRGETAIPGSADAVARLQAAGVQVVYVTNNSAKSARGYVERLERCGISATEEQIVHGGHAVASLVKPGERILLCAGAGVAEGMASVGVASVTPEEIDGWDVDGFDAIILGWRPDFDYRMLSLAVRAVLAGARLLAPSADPLYISADGVMIGGGSLTAAVEHATKTKATFAGKPFQPVVDAVRARVGEVDLVVGDQISSDGGLAKRMGCHFALVETGVANAEPDPTIAVTLRAADLAAVVAARLST